MYYLKNAQNVKQIILTKKKNNITLISQILYSSVNESVTRINMYMCPQYLEKLYI